MERRNKSVVIELSDNEAAQQLEREKRFDLAAQLLTTEFNMHFLPIMDELRAAGYFIVYKVRQSKVLFGRSGHKFPELSTFVPKKGEFLHEGKLPFLKDVFDYGGPTLSDMQFIATVALHANVEGLAQLSFFVLGDEKPDGVLVHARARVVGYGDLNKNEWLQFSTREKDPETIKTGLLDFFDQCRDQKEANDRKVAAWRGEM